MPYGPGVDFPWGILKRRSEFNRRALEDGTIELYENSTGEQEDSVHDFILAHGKGRVVAVYSDIASGYREGAKRPDFDNALFDLQSGRIRGLAVWKLDRLSRRMTETWAVVKMLQEHGGHLITVIEGIDTTDPGKAQYNQAMLSMVAMAAEAEAKAISDRVTLWHARQAKLGLPHRNRLRPTVIQPIGTRWLRKKWTCCTAWAVASSRESQSSRSVGASSRRTSERHQGSSGALAP